MGAYLAIVKGTLDGKVVNVGVEDGGHLGLLDRADTALGVQDEDGDILLAAQTVDGSGSGVATGGTDNSEVMPVLSGLACIAPHEEVFEEVSEQLKGNVLERICGAMKQFQEVQVLLLVKWHERRGLWGAERGITAIDDLLEILRRDF